MVIVQIGVFQVQSFDGSEAHRWIKYTKIRMHGKNNIIQCRCEIVIMCKLVYKVEQQYELP